MGHAYQTVQWNRSKRRYDLCLAGLLLVFLGLFCGLTAALEPDATAESMAIRGTGAAAFLLLHLVLSIGPLARLSPRFLPLLYNRRHLGVTTFAVALVHGVLNLVQYHALGVVNPLLSVFTSQVGTRTLDEFPFQPLGVLALGILFLLAATSHDFWLANLSAPVWKALHMSVYLAWLAALAHVALGVLQAETSPLLAGLVALGAAWILGLHLWAALRERRVDRGVLPAAAPGWVDAGPPEEIADGRAKVITVAGERVAVFRYGSSVSAVSNVCKHQNGPLGEGRILDGCITCPWHGYQYLPENGCSPPPFEEKIATYDVRIEGGRIQVGERAHPSGTRVEPARTAHGAAPAAERGFFVGYLPRLPAEVARFARAAALVLLVLSATLAAVLASSQRTFGPGTFEFRSWRELRGTIELDPAPSLRVARPGQAPEGAPDHSRYLLVLPGKHGARAEVERFAGRAVRLRGALIYRAQRTMVEVQPGSIALDEGARESGGEFPRRELGRVTLMGEIVDSKCHLGVMNPGELSVHRACATLCIRGGIPVLFVARSSSGEVRQMLLVGSDGRALNQEILEWVADPVRITGALAEVDDWLVLSAEPSDIERVGS
jgi:nitrite reductase/ring-hydroxylating ferredoxin subunit